MVCPITQGDHNKH